MKQKDKEGKRPRFIAYVVASIDGRISIHEKKLPDWTSKEDWQFFQQSLARIDAVVVGRNTYLAAAARLRKRNTYVFSRSIKNICRRGHVTFLNPSRSDLKTLFSMYHTVAVLGGTAVYSEMLERGMLDELFVTIEPVIFGYGTQMFGEKMRTKKLTLRSIRRLNKAGTVLLHYTVAKKRI